MQRTPLMLVPLIAVLAATGAWSVSSSARAVAQKEAPAEGNIASEEACRALLAPDFVPVSDTEVVISVALPEEIGEVTEVRTEEGSGIGVVDFVVGDSEESDLTTRLDVAQASAGTWWLEFQGAESTCSALLTIGERGLGA